MIRSHNIQSLGDAVFKNSGVMLGILVRTAVSQPLSFACLVSADTKLLYGMVVAEVKS